MMKALPPHLNKRKFPILEPLGKRKWKLLEDWHYLFKGQIRTIKAGTITDLASTPKFIEADGLYRASVLEHDDLYKNNYFGYERKDADVHMRQRMKEDGVGWLTRWVFYRAVRRFGGLHRAIGGVKRWFLKGR